MNTKIGAGKNQQKIFENVGEYSDQKGRGYLNTFGKYKHFC